jgi:hypothetical protein
VAYGGMVGDDEDDEVERSAVVNHKGIKRSPSNYVRFLKFLVYACKKLIEYDSLTVVDLKDRSGLARNVKPVVEAEKNGSLNTFQRGRQRYLLTN